MGVETALIASLALSAGSQVIGGVMDNAAYKKEAESYRQQGAIAQQENALEAKQKQREIDKLAAQQVMGMAKSGVLTSEGSPLEILNETISLGKEEVDAIKNRGVALGGYYNSMSNQSINKGRSAILGGITGATSTALTGYYSGVNGGVFGTASKTKTATTTVNKTKGVL